MSIERFEEMERDMGVLAGRTTSLRRELSKWHDIIGDLQRAFMTARDTDHALWRQVAEL